ncbi:peptidylprolyl isomerase [Flammeovirga yaeyamensis]|uniref:Peptidylprolyl isomerase n=1 Tax=Flammeovirga yaeyamensis TaxID=367791 RepID=A0AAX1NB98_9BACT|nr:peptidylprolyl isomerase [Flammeovirga yaeyamensis]MBB3699048.1 peptidyl-prolyl cis-trans isomerase SurA [Flammeovirga yaeyamensis]NMF36482.1 hypothetical protein [Flammeovirga yaeyamensis]QWG03560.1 peptidylprolyl isomerase [Flammeovirga yaeyamensis]
MLNKTSKVYTYLLIIGCVISGCTMPMKSGSTSISSTSPALLHLDQKDVTKENFVYLYEKNYQKDSSFYTQESIDEYLDLFINFKLKVAEAEALGYDTLDAFKNEYKMYVEQLEEPYLTESVFNDSLVKQAYERQKEEVRASHILINCKPDAIPEDTLKAYNKALEVLNKYKNGEQFPQLAFEFSEDPSAKQNKGDLGYFTSLQMVYPFEEAAYNTKIGDVAGPIRTQFGYHLLYIQDKRTRYGTLQAQHIMIKSSIRNSPEDQKAHETKIFAIYDSLQNGGDWDQLCSTFSEDKRTSTKKGILPPVSEVRFPPAFLKGIEAVDKVGDIAQPIQTDFGWHIIRLYRKEPVKPYDVMYPSLVKKVKRDSRSSTSKEQFIQKLKNDNHFIPNDENKTIAFSQFDSTLLEGKWSLKESTPTKIKKKTLFTIHGKKVMNNDFFVYVSDEQKRTSIDSLEEVLEQYYERFVNQTLIEVEREKLPTKYPEFAHLSQEYKDGLLLFRVMEDSVWNKATSDPELLKEFYTKNIDHYQYEDRVEVDFYNTGNKELENETIVMLDSGYYKVFPSDISSLYFKKGSSYLYKTTVGDLNNITNVLNKDANLFVEFDIQMPKNSGTVLKKNRIKKISAFLEKEKIDLSKIKFVESEGSEAVNVQFYSTLTSNYIPVKNRMSNLSVNFETGVYTKEDLPHADQINFKVGRYIFQEGNRYIIADVKTFLPKGPKPFDVSKGAVIADYQQEIEKQWLSDLHKKHEVIIDSTILQSLYNHKKTM